MLDSIELDAYRIDDVVFNRWPTHRGVVCATSKSMSRDWMKQLITFPNCVRACLNGLCAGRTF